MVWKKTIVHGVFFLVALGLVLLCHFSRLVEIPPLPPEGDPALHEAQAAAFQAVAHTPIPLGQKVCALWAWQSPYPPLMSCSTWLWSEAAGATGNEVCVASFAIFIVLLAAGAYIIGDDCGGPAVGATAVLLTGHESDRHLHAEQLLHR